MKPVFRLVPLLVTAVLASASFAAPRPLFSPAPLSSFDGKRWTGLTLGQSTFKDVRPLFETGDGAYERSTELTMPKNSGLRVDCLWSKRDKDQILTAITLRYSGVTPSSDQLEQAFDPEGNEGEALYLRGRYEDWRVIRFPGRGVTAFQLLDGDHYATPLLVLTSPDVCARLSEALREEETAVEERVDPMANEPKVGEFGDISVDFIGNETDVIPTWERTDLRDELRDANAGGTLRWNRGAGGFYKMRVTGSRDKKKDAGSFSISTEIEAQGPYGTISVSGSGSERWKRDDDDYARTPSSAFDRAVREARRDVENKFERAMLASGPPTIEAVREEQWRELVTMLRAPLSTVPAGTTGTGGPVLGF